MKLKNSGVKIAYCDSIVAQKIGTLTVYFRYSEKTLCDQFHWGSASPIP